MKEVKVCIKGLTDLLMDKMDVEVLLNTVRTPKRYTEAVLQAMADKAVYLNKDGLFIPSRNVKKCMIEGAKMGRIKLNVRQNLHPFIEASVFVQPSEITLNKGKPDGYIQFAMRRKDGNVIPKRLPLCRDWELSFALQIFDDEIVDKVNEAIVVAGLSVGLGNQRPEYGRFEIVKWEVMK